MGRVRVHLGGGLGLHPGPPTIVSSAPVTGQQRGAAHLRVSVGAPHLGPSPCVLPSLRASVSPPVKGDINVPPGEACG